MLLVRVSYVANAESIVRVLEILGFQIIFPGYLLESVSEHVQVPSEEILHGFVECVEPINQFARRLKANFKPASIIPAEFRSAMQARFCQSLASKIVTLGVVGLAFGAQGMLCRNCHS